jgi:predicted secreted protein
MELFKILLLLIFFVFLSVPSALGASGTSTVTVSKADNGKEITVPKGGVIEVQMEFPAGTGYSWEIIDLDKEHLELLDVGSKPLKEGPIAGGPVLKTWRLKAVGTGRTELKMYYYRVWEGLENAAEKFQVRVRIS